jgi:hypothetical protein
LQKPHFTRHCIILGSFKVIHSYFENLFKFVHYIRTLIYRITFHRHFEYFFEMQILQKMHSSSDSRIKQTSQKVSHTHWVINSLYTYNPIRSLPFYHVTHDMSLAKSLGQGQPTRGQRVIFDTPWLFECFSKYFMLSMDFSHVCMLLFGPPNLF